MNLRPASRIRRYWSAPSKASTLAFGARPRERIMARRGLASSPDGDRSLTRRMGALDGVEQVVSLKSCRSRSDQGPSLWRTRAREAPGRQEVVEPSGIAPESGLHPR